MRATQATVQYCMDLTENRWRPGEKAQERRVGFGDVHWHSQRQAEEEQRVPPWIRNAQKRAKTYLTVEPFHLFRYLDEQAFRYNNRRGNDSQRFDLAVRQIMGKRLTWNQLTGKMEAVHTQ
jgi:hypothetical protein